MPPCDRADQKESIDGLLGPNSTWTIVVGHGLDPAMAGQSAKFKFYNTPYTLNRALTEKKEVVEATISASTSMNAVHRGLTVMLTRPALGR